MNKTANFDCIVIGGGPAGLMAGIAAAETSAKVLLIEKGDSLGRKLTISGGGRCNVTNSQSVDEIIKHIPGNGRFLHSVFAQFDNQDIIQFFEKLAVPLKEEDHGRMFPKDNQAKSVVNALTKRFAALKGTTFLNTTVADILFENGKAVAIQLENKEIITAKSFIIATGGGSAPHTGSTGDGYTWAELAGHTITELYPTEVPLLSNEPFIRKKSLQGLSLQNVIVTILNAKGKAIVSHQMDIIFTHFGLSGPAVLRCSQFVVKELQKTKQNEITLQLDTYPAESVENLIKIMMEISKNQANKSVKNALKGLLPERLLLFLLTKANIDANATCATINNTKWKQLAQDIKKWEIKVNGTLPLEKAFVTGGGISIKEIAPKTMASKLIPNLFFCGEILDIHGYTGGYNITAALSTGRIAGKYAGKLVN